MTQDRIIRSGRCKDTGYPVEQWQRGDFIPFGAKPTFWFAYPDDRRNPFAGAPGDTKAEAVRKMLAKQRIAA